MNVWICNKLCPSSKWQRVIFACTDYATPISVYTFLISSLFITCGYFVINLTEVKDEWQNLLWRIQLHVNWKGKGKVVAIHTIQVHRGSGGKLHSFLNLGTTWTEWSASHSDHFTAGERASGIHWIKSWIGPRPGLDILENKSSAPARIRSLDHAICSPV